MTLSKTTRRISALLTASALLLGSSAASAGYCAQLGGHFSNDLLRCPGSGAYPGDFSTSGSASGFTQSGTKKATARLFQGNGNDYIAAYVYGIRSNGQFNTSCFAITYQTGNVTDHNCNGSSTFNFYIYAA